MSETKMIVPVTPALRDALVAVHEHITEYDASTIGLSDQGWYVKTVSHLELLVNRVLTAPTAAPLTAVLDNSARFDMGHGSTVAERVSLTVAYLRNTVAEVLKNQSQLSKYGDEKTQGAVRWLRTLYSGIMASVELFAREDLASLRSLGPDALVKVAHHVATTIAESRDGES